MSNKPLHYSSTILHSLPSVELTFHSTTEIPASKLEECLGTIPRKHRKLHTFETAATSGRGTLSEALARVRNVTNPKQGRQTRVHVQFQTMAYIYPKYYLNKRNTRRVIIEYIKDRLVKSTAVKNPYNSVFHTLF